ncbi:unnamed protein product [Phytophthora lilii]|uniref:Unnamed protein product n=1 Tax=Phytophthora lilii TaxID=2077276 RepID=A0A9W6WQ57_9STRA|nr:unnamed protein product [Phytophthora lilii]
MVSSRLEAQSEVDESPRTDVDHSCSSTTTSPLVSAAKSQRDEWCAPASCEGFLPLLADNAFAGPSPAPATATVASPHPRRKLYCPPVADLPRGKRGRGLTPGNAAMRSWNSPRDARQWENCQQELAGVTRRTKRKVAQSPESSLSDHHDDTAQSTEEVTVVKRKKKRGYRTATHTIRKVRTAKELGSRVETSLVESIDQLRVELAQLEAQMTELQQRALAPGRDEEDEEERRLYTKVLHNAVKKHQEAFVEIQSAMTGYAACVRMRWFTSVHQPLLTPFQWFTLPQNIQAGSPIQRIITLEKEEQSRRAALREMKTLKLQDAREFFSRRLSQLDPLKSTSEDYRFENHEGDYWAVRFATSQFESAKSVKQIFDMVVYYLCNIEISVSEKMGHLTVREDDDNGEEGITQNRLVSLTGKGLRMESNVVVFSEYYRGTKPDNQDDYGLIVAEFVDDDERYPFLLLNPVLNLGFMLHAHSQQYLVVVMVLGSSREQIRDDRYYTSLLLGPRAPSAASVSPLTSPAGSVDDGSAHTLLALKTSLENPSSTQKGMTRKREKPIESGTESEPQEKQKRSAKRKYRKATHTLRKEEKERLQKELDGLHTRMEELKKRALKSFGKPGQNDKDRIIASKVLRDAVQSQQLEFANIQGIMSEFTTIQFHGVESVKQVFDLLVQYFCSIEISISEKLGHITIREDDDSGDKGITQNRLVSTTVNGMLMESNTVLFSHFFEPDEEPGHEKGRGLIVADFVNEDDRHPYKPRERVRRDINAILELTSYTRKVAMIGGTFEKQLGPEEESVVVLTRWVFSQLHRPSFSVSTGNWEEMRDNMDRWGETMHRTMVESLTPMS